MESKDNTQNKVADIRKMPKPKMLKLNLVITLIVAVLIIGGFVGSRLLDNRGAKVPLSDLAGRVEKGEYEKIIEKTGIVILERKEKYENGEGEGEIIREYANFKETGKGTFYDLMKSNDVTIDSYEFQPEKAITFESIFVMISIAVALWLFYMLIQGMQSSGKSLTGFGESKARMLFGKRVGVTFGDVAGMDEAREEVTEVVDFLKKPQKYLEIGARIPKGVLLVGAPGTGKTLLAKAVAGEAGVPFFETSGSEFEEMLVGAGASRVRDLFKKAKRVAPCIIFIDEIDAVARKRGTSLNSSANTEQTLNQILVEMDGLEEKKNVIILAATNRPDVLDPAILRPGRFDRTVVIQMPDLEGRKQILAVHAKNKKFEQGVDLDMIAKKTMGYSGADLENLLNESAIMAAKENRKMISQDDLLEAYLKVKLGRQKKSKRTDDDVKIVAYHEAGHAVVAKMTKSGMPVEKISIISRGYSGGVTVYLPKDESEMLTKTDLIARIQQAVGGRVAEELFLNDVSTGASSDIQEATKIARAMVKKYGMSKGLGFVKYQDEEDESILGYQYGVGKNYSEKTAELIDAEVRDIMESAINNARDILRDNRQIVEKLVAQLLEREVVDKDEFEKMFD